MSRFRADEDCVPTELVSKYYSQRGGQPGTLLITEATLISPRAAGFKHCPGIYNDAQVAQWKRVTDAVHARGSYIFLQLWALGRAAFPDVIEGEGYSYTAPSPIGLSDRPKVPRALTISEIKQLREDYVQSALKAIEAGFDGIEIHGANGYLLDQFLQDVSNQRTDEYGGSIENRARFPLEVIQAIVDAIGEKRVGYRISPWGEFQGMGMEDPIPQFAYFVKEVKKRFPSLAYLHVIEPRVNGNITREDGERKGASNDVLREIWKPKPYISVGGFTHELAIDLADSTGNLVAFGRPFIANPDLVLRLKNNWPLIKGNRATYYVIQSESPEAGYTDYPTYELQTAKI